MKQKEPVRCPPMSKTLGHLLLFKKIEGIDTLGRVLQIISGIIVWSFIALATLQQFKIVK